MSTDNQFQSLILWQITTIVVVCSLALIQAWA